MLLMRGNKPPKSAATSFALEKLAENSAATAKTQRVIAVSTSKVADSRCRYGFPFRS